jgi:hypothetical protein
LNVVDFIRGKEVIPEISDATDFSVEDISPGNVVIEGMIKITGPKELGGKMGTIEYVALMNIESGEVNRMKKVEFRVMGDKIK